MVAAAVAAAVPAAVAAVIVGVKIRGIANIEITVAVGGCFCCCDLGMLWICARAIMAVVIIAVAAEGNGGSGDVAG